MYLPHPNHLGQVELLSDSEPLGGKWNDAERKIHDVVLAALDW